MTSPDVLTMTSRFTGCFLGSLLGDCTGFPFESSTRYGKNSAVKVQKYFDNLECSSMKDPYLIHTDDSAMAICIAESLIEKWEVDVHDIAKRFVKEYNHPLSRRRAYGIHVRDVFRKLDETMCRDPLGPAREQFQGMGSYGNGGAMRVTPIALFFCGQGTQVMRRAAQQITEITHTHPHGINGAILQCLAVEQSLQLPPEQPIDTSAFLEELITKMKLYEEEAQPFTTRLLWALELLQKEKRGLKKINEDRDVLARLGTGIEAIKSVPTAIFCFLRAHQGDIPGIKTSNPLRRTLQYAISLGGDTDTIACMAGALSGAALGYRPEYFNENILKRCEGVDKVMKLADLLYSKSHSQKKER